MKSGLNWIIGLTLVIGFWMFSWQNIAQVPTHNFDEFHYIPAAKSFMNHGPIINVEHPPLGKMIISWGLSIKGDNPMGWRLMSSIFGALTLAGIFLWSMILFRSLATALFISTLTIANQMLYVQSRIAMLDTFMTAFLIWAGLCFSYWWKNKKNNYILAACGFFLGLALATKWFTFFPIALAGLFILYSGYKTKTIQPTLIFSIVLFLSYAICFYPMASHDHGSWSQFFQWQIDMWSLQQRVPGTHPYLSAWYSWPLELRPIWYAYTPSADRSTFQGVVLLGNPLILWGGLLSVFYSAWLSLKKKCPIARETLIIYLIFFLSWAVIPRKATFFYYYYPAALMLGFMLARTLDDLRPRLKQHFEFVRWSIASVSVGLFIYFLPILSGEPAPLHSLRAWCWFQSWI